jgi:AcrR family transcriptional regulator
VGNVLRNFTPDYSMGKLTENKNRNRHRILDAAFTLFADKGLAQTSIADVVTAAGLARGTFYNYFSNLDEVWGALINEHFSAIATRARESRQRAKNIEDFIVGAYRTYFEMVIKTPKVLPLIVRNQSAVRETYYAGPVPTTVFQQLEEDMHASGFFSHLSQEQIRIFSIAMIGAVSELLAQSVSRGIMPDPVELADTLSSLFLQGIAKSSNGN